MNDNDMIPVFVPRNLGMRAVHSFACQHDCKLIQSKSGALIMEPRQPKRPGAKVLFLDRPSAAHGFAPEVA